MNDNHNSVGSINDKKLKLYENACKFVELTTRFIHIGYIKIIFPLATVPYLLVSYFNYYTKDFEKDAFILPFVTWYV